MDLDLNPKDIPSVAIIGIGNILCCDEGIGVHVINELRQIDLPSYLDITDCGTSGIAVIEAMDGTQKAIIMDAVAMDGEPGTIYRYDLNDLLQMGDKLVSFVSFHQFDLLSTFQLADQTTVYKLPPELVIIGIEVKSLEDSWQLSEEVNQVVPAIIELVKQEIENFVSKM